MVGIVLASHGKFAEGILDAAQMLFGEVEQVACVSLQPGMSPEDYQGCLAQAAEEVDTGEGSIILCDILGGTPSNRAAFLMSRMNVVAGINLALFIELLGQRLDGELNITDLVEIGRQGMAHMNPLFGVTAPSI